MAKKIEYLVGSEPNYIRSFGYPGTWYARRELPDDIDTIRHIRLDNLASTENVAALFDYEVEETWEALTEGAPLPEGMGDRTALAFAQAIWLDTFLKLDDGEALCQAFRKSLMMERAKKEYEEGEWEEETGWDAVFKAGKETGADLRVDAWLAGAPFDVVLAE